MLTTYIISDANSTPDEDKFIQFSFDATPVNFLKGFRYRDSNPGILRERQVCLPPTSYRMLFSLPKSRFRKIKYK
jgi:hypothetical protein